MAAFVAVSHKGKTQVYKGRDTHEALQRAIEGERRRYKIKISHAWPADADTFLRQQYRVLSAAEIARALALKYPDKKWTRNAVIGRAHRLAQRKPLAWPVKADQFIKATYKDKTAEQIAEALSWDYPEKKWGRLQVKERARQLGLKKTDIPAHTVNKPSSCASI